MADGTRSALIVASDEYSDPGLRRLRAPASDAQALTAVLRDPAIGDFQVRTLLNRPAHEVNLAAEEFFADRRPDDLLLLHVSSHGIKDEDGQLYFAAADTRLRWLGATAVAAEFVNRLMSRSRSRRVVLLLDCCYAGAFERGMTARAGSGMGIEEQFGGRGRAVITASSAMEYAFEGDELSDTRELAPSVFTSALVDGLRTGEADRDQDGMVALDELYDYVYDRVRAATPNQTPGKWMFGVQGDLYIARRARPVTTPAPLPRELQEAIDSPFAGVRGGAVQELERLLRSRHAGLALAAGVALHRLANDDSRTVSSAATAALSAQTQPPPEPAPPEPARFEPAPPEPAPFVAAPLVAAPLEAAPLEAAPPSGAVAAGVQARDTEPTPPPSTEPAAPESARQAVVSSEPAPVPAAAAGPAQPAPGRTAGDVRLRIAGQLAILGAVLLILGLFPAYRWGGPLIGVPDELWYAVIVGAVAFGAGVCLLLPLSRRLIGPGLLIGIAAFSALALLGTVIDRLVQKDGFEGGYWVELAGHAIVILAAWFAGLALARDPEVRLPRRRPEGPLPWLAGLLGLANAVVVSFHIQRLSQAQWGWYITVFVLLTLMALVVPVWAAAVVPRQLGAFLLGGWAVGGAAFSLSNVLLLDRLRGEDTTDVAGGLMLLLGLAMLALLVVAVVLARTDPAHRVEHPAQG